MNVKTPALKQLADGRWVTKWGGRRHYLGRDRKDAIDRYSTSLKEWATWREGIDLARNSSRRGMSVIELTVRFLEFKRVEKSLFLSRKYKGHLRRFLDAYKGLAVDQISVKHLNTIKYDMLQAGMAPRTINHDINAMKHLFGWAAENELCQPMQLKGCKKIPLGPVDDQSISVKQVRAMVQRCKMPVKAWLGIAYLTCARPVEVVRLVHRQGQWDEPGVFRLAVGKTDVSSKQHRRMILSDFALEWLDLCEPVWSMSNTYCSAVNRANGMTGGSRILRHSAATHLSEAGVPRADIDSILGHMPTRVSLTYNPVRWQPLRALVARINPTLDGLLPLD